MADFDTAYRIVHGHEGGYANTAGDKGGETYMGISRRWHPTWPGWVYIDAWKALHGQPPNNTFFKDSHLTDDVVTFYKASWNEIGGPQIKSQPVASLLYDFATGTGSAVRVAQGVLVGMGFKLNPDNQVGAQTLAAINAADPPTFYNRLKAARIAYLKAIVVKHPDQAKFLPNWLARCAAFVDLPQKKTVSRSRS